jgi:AAA family ATP:ADP antiporter
MDNSSNNPLANIRDILWPIKREEINIFLPMSLMMFCILFNFSALRSIKDGLVVPNIGAEVISFLKFWVVLPSAIFFSLLYTKLSNIFRYEQIFYMIVSFFLSIIFLFAFIVYPNEAFFHPNPETVAYYAELYPNFQWQIRIMGKWSYAIVYVVGELWSAIVITLMFWQLANSRVTTSQASRLYPYFALVGNLGLVLSGAMMVFSTRESVPEFVILFLGENLHGASDRTLKISALSITFFGIISIFLYRYIALYTKSTSLENPDFKSKLKLSVKDSLKLVIHSRYLWKILAMVIAYGLAVNIVEGPWKSKVSELYPTTAEYIGFMGKFNVCMGLSCVIFTIGGSAILRFWNWFVGALMTPIMFGITGGSFFIFVVFAAKFKEWDLVLLDPVFAAVLFGAVQNIMSKSTKYSLFDATKEMAYIPLDEELKTKGKAAVDVIGTKLGKSTGALIQSLMFSFFPFANFDMIAPYLMVIFMAIVFMWIFAVSSLREEYLAKVKGE